MSILSAIDTGLTHRLWHEESCPSICAIQLVLDVTERDIIRGGAWNTNEVGKDRSIEVLKYQY